MVEIQENVRGRDVFVVQPTCEPTNDNLMELLVMIDALRWASAAGHRGDPVLRLCTPGSATAFGACADYRAPRGEDVQTAGADRILTMDLHADQIQGFFDIPVDNMYASPILLGDIWKQKYPDLMVVSPDVGGVVRARALAKRLDDADLAIIDKRRPKANEAQVMNIIGDVEGRSTCVLVDDLVDTAGTLCKAAGALKEHGAAKVVAYCTHPVLSGPAVTNIESSLLDELVVTNTVPLRDEAANCTKIRPLSIAGLLAESIRRINNEESVSSLFVD